MSLSANAVRALVNGERGDPFSVLGPHAEVGGGLVVRAYRAEPALHEMDSEPDGFRWMDCADADQSVVAFCQSVTLDLPPLGALLFRWTGP